jgi:hypothetical protein
MDTWINFEEDKRNVFLVTKSKDTADKALRNVTVRSSLGYATKQ